MTFFCGTQRHNYWVISVQGRNSHQNEPVRSNLAPRDPQMQHSRNCSPQMSVLGLEEPGVSRCNRSGQEGEQDSHLNLKVNHHSSYTWDLITGLLWVLGCYSRSESSRIYSNCSFIFSVFCFTSFLGEKLKPTDEWPLTLNKMDYTCNFSSTKPVIYRAYRGICLI